MIPALAFALALGGAPDAPAVQAGLSPARQEGTIVAARRRDTKDEDEGARRRRRGPRPPPRARGPITVPIDVGFGPALLVPNPPAFSAQPLYGGLALSLAAVIDKELIEENRDKIPAGLRQAARGIREVRYRPWFLALVPELLLVSPQIEGLASTGAYGALWRPLGLGVNLVDEPVALSLNANLDLAYIFFHSSALGGGSALQQSFTHFLRPGLNLELALEIPVTETLLFSTGWSSDFFVPQPFGRPPWEVLPLEDALWHLGGPFLKMHIRIPYTVDSF
jgi:hypothetical protein